MTPAIANKIIVEPKWPIAKVQEASAKAVAREFLAAFSVLCKHGKEAVEGFQQAMHAQKLEYYKSLGIKTPIELVKAMAEYESNVFGSKIEIWGDEKQASLSYTQCGMWNAMKELGKMTPEMEEKMGTWFQTCVTNLGKDFGFTGEVNFEGETSALVTFTK